MTARKWTSEEVTELRRLNELEITTMGIARHLGRPKNSIHSKMKQLGIKRPKGAPDGRVRNRFQPCGDTNYKNSAKRHERNASAKRMAGLEAPRWPR